MTNVVWSIWHQTLKGMLTEYCVETEKSWDERIYRIIFVPLFVREITRYFEQRKRKPSKQKKKV